jgi:3-hydroxyacyl-[acyl-carrier-protein] dehydratase
MSSPGQEKVMTLDISQIQNIIPHRFPFLLVDRIIELVPNEKLIALKNVSINEEFFVGHFPHEKVMPGVLIVEAMAQAGCIYYYYSKNMQGKQLTYYLAKMNAKFIKPVVPGDQLIMEIQTVRMMAMAGFLKGVATVNGVKVAEAEVGFGIKENL